MDARPQRRLLHRPTPASCTCRSIQDPVYGYQRVNVEAAAGTNSSSLLHWTRRHDPRAAGASRVRARRRSATCGGSNPSGARLRARRRRTATSRTAPRRAVLCVNNLVAASRSRCELTLRDGFEGWRPIELLGGVPASPTIGELPLPAHPRVATASTGSGSSPRSGGEQWLSSTTTRRSHRATLELLEEWHAAPQRWFAGKGEPLRRLRRLAPVAARRRRPVEVGIETARRRRRVAVTSRSSTRCRSTYRGEPQASARARRSSGPAEHAVLGRRWVYDALHDRVYATQLLELVQGRVRAARRWSRTPSRRPSPACGSPSSTRAVRVTRRSF